MRGLDLDEESVLQTADRGVRLVMTALLVVESVLEGLAKGSRVVAGRLTRPSPTHPCNLAHRNPQRVDLPVALFVVITGSSEMDCLEVFRDGGE